MLSASARCLDFSIPGVVPTGGHARTTRSSKLTVVSAVKFEATSLTAVETPGDAVAAPCSRVSGQAGVPSEAPGVVEVPPMVESAEAPGKPDWASVVVPAGVDPPPSQVSDVDAATLQVAVAYLIFDGKCGVVGLASKAGDPCLETTTGPGGVILPIRPSPVANTRTDDVTEQYDQLAVAAEASGPDT